MRFEYEGMALWYGMPDTPAPEGAVHVGTDITVTIAVKPADASNKVELLYRRDQGTVETVPAKWLRHDLSNNVQYFKARFPAFRVGDMVEYTAACYCAGHQVPSRSEVQQLASSFHIVAAEPEPTSNPTIPETPMLKADGAKGSGMSALSPMKTALHHTSPAPEPSHLPAPEASRSDSTTWASMTQPPGTMPCTSSLRLHNTMLDKSVLDHFNTNTASKASIGETLNAALKSKLSRAFMENGHTELAGLIRNMSSADMGAYKDVSLRAFVANQVQSKVQYDVVLKKAVDDAISQLSTTTTVGDLLGLNKPLAEQPEFQGEVQKVQLSAVLGTSPMLVNPDLQAKLIDLYAAHEGTAEQFWSMLRQQPDFKAPGLVENLQFTGQLDALTLGSVAVMKALQGMQQQGSIQSVRDLTKRDSNAWKQIVSASADGIPAQVVPGAPQDERVTNYVDSITSTLHEAFPTTYVAQSIAQPAQVDLALVQRVLGLNPGLNPAAPLPATLNLTRLSADEQQKAKNAFTVLHQEIKAYPAFEYKAALAAGGTTLQNPVRQAVAQFFVNAPDFDFRDTHIATYLREVLSTC